MDKYYLVLFCTILETCLYIWKYLNKFEEKLYAQMFTKVLFNVLKAMSFLPSTTLSGFHGFSYVALPLCLNNWNFPFDFVLFRRMLITSPKCGGFVLACVDYRCKFPHFSLPFFLFSSSLPSLSLLFSPLLSTTTFSSSFFSSFSLSFYFLLCYFYADFFMLISNLLHLITWWGLYNIN